MQTKEEILKEYVDFEDINGSQSVELLPLTVVDCMEEYSKQKSMGFGRWLLKNADIFLDKDGAFEWGMYDDVGTVVAMTTEEIFNKYDTK